jgi:hypothetical protein
MYRCIEYTISGERADRSRFAVSYSESTFHPAASDLAIDQALEDFAAMTLRCAARTPRGSMYGGSQHLSYRPSNIMARPSTSYEHAGSRAGNSTTSRGPPLKMISYPGPRSTVSTRSRHSLRGAVVPYPYAQPSVISNAAGSRHAGGREEMLTQYSGTSKCSKESYDELGPEDSISQVSSSSRRSSRRETPLCALRTSERRGRTRRREHEKMTVVKSGPLMYAGPEYAGPGDGYGGARVHYETREVTPWDEN